MLEWKRDLLIYGWALYLIALSANAQTPKLQFDVASVKPTPPVTGLTFPSETGGPGTSIPSRFTWTRANVHNLLVRAYGLLDRDQQVVGPKWIDSELYDLSVTMPASTTEAQFQEMLQSLLAERFKLVVHHDTKMIPVYDLVVGKNGPKLKESVVPSSSSDVPRTPVSIDKKDKDGFVTMPPGFVGAAMTTGPGPSGEVTRNWVYGQHTMAQFAGMLKVEAGRNVIDKTGLSAKYDIKLYFDPPQRAALNSAIPERPVLTIFDAMEQQLGLKLVDTKAPFDVVVVDSGDNVPTEN